MYLRHCLHHAFANLTCSLEQDDLEKEKELKLWVVALNNLLNAIHASVKTSLASPPYLVVLEYKMRVETGHGTEAFQELSRLPSTSDIISPTP